MIRRKSKKREMAQDVAAVNRIGCGCVVFVLFGIIAAMIVAGYLQLR